MFGTRDAITMSFTLCLRIDESFKVRMEKNNDLHYDFAYDSLKFSILIL